MNKVKITRGGFERWLKSRHPRTVVGMGRQICDCPISKYLTLLATQQLGHKPYVVRVRTTEYFFSDGKGHGWTTNTPDWMRNFINHIDHYADEVYEKEGARFPNILAHRALTLLRAS